MMWHGFAMFVLIGILSNIHYEYTPDTKGVVPIMRGVPYPMNSLQGMETDGHEKEFLKACIAIAQFAYCKNNHQTCDDVDTGRFRDVTRIKSNGVTAVVAYDINRGSIAVGFRGTSNMRNWANNLKITPITPTGLGVDSKVHQGFVTNYNKRPLCKGDR